jgi:hypothetical protein
VKNFFKTIIEFKKIFFSKISLSILFFLSLCFVGIYFFSIASIDFLPNKQSKTHEIKILILEDSEVYSCFKNFNKIIDYTNIKTNFQKSFSGKIDLHSTNYLEEKREAVIKLRTSKEIKNSEIKKIVEDYIYERNKKNSEDYKIFYQNRLNYLTRIMTSNPNLNITGAIINEYADNLLKEEYCEKFYNRENFLVKMFVLEPNLIYYSKVIFLFILIHIVSVFYLYVRSKIHK